MKITCCAALSALAALVSCAPAAAQFRPDEPATLAAPANDVAPQDGQAVADAFRRRYDRARRPSVALFWNRELTDRLARPTIRRQAVHGEASESTSVVGGAGVLQAHGWTAGSLVTETSTDTPADPARGGLDERSESQLHSAFLSALGGGGLHPVDRSMMLRATALHAGGAVDPQANETRGLQGKARYLMEVLLVRDPEAPLGVGFQVTVKDVASAAILFSGYTVARPPAAGPGAWIGTNDGQGFERASAPPVAVGDVGRALALDVMSRMTAAL